MGLSLSTKLRLLHHRICGWTTRRRAKFPPDPGAAAHTDATKRTGLIKDTTKPATAEDDYREVAGGTTRRQLLPSMREQLTQADQREVDLNQYEEQSRQDDDEYELRSVEMRTH